MDCSSVRWVGVRSCTWDVCDLESRRLAENRWLARSLLFAVPAHCRIHRAPGRCRIQPTIANDHRDRGNRNHRCRCRPCRSGRLVSRRRARLAGDDRRGTRARSAVNLLLIIRGFAAFVRSEAAAAEERVVGVAGSGDEAVAIDDVEEAGRVLLGKFATHGCCAPAVAADELRLSFHDYFSPAAANTGVMSTGMSFSVALTAAISGVSLPYLSSSVLARA